MTTVEPATAAALLPVYRRAPVLFTGGEGCELIAEDGTRFLDFVAGIAVNPLGYHHPALKEAIWQAAETGLLHTSNFYRTAPGEELASALVEQSFASHVFFCNSGSEAIEAAIKFVRLSTGKTEMIAAKMGYHGKTMGSLSFFNKVLLISSESKVSSIWFLFGISIQAVYWFGIRFEKGELFLGSIG